MPLRPTEAPAHSSFSFSFWMSFGSSPIRFWPTSFACAYMPGPPARLEYANPRPWWPSREVSSAKTKATSVRGFCRPVSTLASLIGVFNGRNASESSTRSILSAEMAVVAGRVISFMLIRLDVGFLDHLGPGVDLQAQAHNRLLGRHLDCVGPLLQELLLGLGRGEDLLQLRIEAVDDGLGRPGGHEHAE